MADLTDWKFGEDYKLSLERSRTAAGPVPELKSGDTLEFAFIVGDESEPLGFGASSNPETVDREEPLLSRTCPCANGSIPAASQYNSLALLLHGSKKGRIGDDVTLLLAEVSENATSHPKD